MITSNGLCKYENPEIWFDPTTFNQAKAICAQCPFKVACLQAAEERGEEYGVWGGKTPGERGFKHAEADPYP